MTVKFETTRLGPIEVHEEKVITFDDGLYGFESCRRFVILDLPKSSGHLRWMQSVDDPDLGFVLIDPSVFRPDYSPEADEDSLRVVGLGSVSEGVVMAICSVPEDPRQMTANLQAPLVFNPVGCSGKQLVLADPRWGLRHNVLEEMAQFAKSPSGQPAAPNGAAVGREG